MEKNIEQYQKISEILKVLAHPVRLCIVHGLMEKGECNVTHMQLCLDTPQSTVSQHLQRLKSAGIIEGRRSGLEIYYRLHNPEIARWIDVMMGEQNAPRVEKEGYHG